jgi:hypothetical protein
MNRLQNLEPFKRLVAALEPWLDHVVIIGGVAHPIWTDSRDQLKPTAGCRTGLAMEAVFTAAVK